jgi:hypothetical protein
MFDKFLEESVSEAEVLTETLGREADPQVSRPSAAAALSKAVRSLPVDFLLVAVVAVWAVPQKSITWWS